MSLLNRPMTDDPAIPPYGGDVLPLPGGPDEALSIEGFQVELDDETAYHLVMLASGAYSPLYSFMGRDEYLEVVETHTLRGKPWGAPVALPLPKDTVVRPRDGITLIYRELPVAHMTVRQVFVNPARPDMYLAGGPINSVFRSNLPLTVPTPDSIRSSMARNKWTSMIGLLLDEPWNRGHEYLVKAALETNDAVAIFVCPRDQSGLPAATLCEASDVLFGRYFREERVVRIRLPACSHPNSGAGVLQLAIVAQNFGCHTLALPPSCESVLADARASMADPQLSIKTELLSETFYCNTCASIATAKSCPHEPVDRLRICNHDVHKTLLAGNRLPSYAARPEVARVMTKTIGAVGISISGGSNVFTHDSEITPELREAMLGHKPCVIWMTGLSGAGKSTVACRLELMLVRMGYHACTIDGDGLRHGLNKDLDFSEVGRKENLRRAAEVAKLVMEAGSIVICAFISPTKAQRDAARTIIGERFFETYIEADLDTCESRDVKGFYARARRGEIANFTGISAPYEPPECPDLRVKTSSMSIDQCAAALVEQLRTMGVLPASTP